MKKFFITGDRSLSPIIAAKLVDAVIEDIISQHGTDIGIGTGNLNKGVERAVRFLVPDGVCNVVPYDTDGNGNPDFVGTYRNLKENLEGVEAVFIHMDPLSSHIGRALAEVFEPERVHMPMQDVMSSL